MPQAEMFIHKTTGDLALRVDDNLGALAGSKSDKALSTGELAIIRQQSDYYLMWETGSGTRQLPLTLEQNKAPDGQAGEIYVMDLGRASQADRSDGRNYCLAVNISDAVYLSPTFLND